jgi:hypothetical protein
MYEGVKNFNLLSISLFSPNMAKSSYRCSPTGLHHKLWFFWGIVFGFFSKKLGNCFVVLVQIRAFLPHFLKRNSKFFISKN